jgi:UDP-3-O-[3-hydroxymyristoyl] glucosamine N-acyltransferase
MKLGELVDLLGGKLVQGSPETRIAGVNSTVQAGPDYLVFAQDEASATDALSSNAGAVVLRPGLVATYPQRKAIVETLQPRLWFSGAARVLRPAPTPKGIVPSAVVAANANVGQDVTIGPCAVIEEDASIGAGTEIGAGTVIGEGVRIGEDCHIYPRVVIYPGTTLGDRVVVHAGAVLGSDGFGYVRDSTTGVYTQFPQQGTLVIEDDVEIGANSTIDRGALAETRVRRGVKIDNLVHIGHNCDIGEDVILVALTGISGSSSVGRGAVIAGQVGIGDHAHVGEGVILGGQAGVLSGKTVTNEGLKPGTVLWGTPARPLKQVLREIAVLSRLAKGKGRGAARGEE